MTKKISIGLCVFLFVFMVVTWIVYRELPSELDVLLFFIFLADSLRLTFNGKSVQK
ncbi:hypothetical protein AWA1501_09540 [Lactiplantibacillus pentosus]|jgi:hypothetical protein|nr:hypothetical protein KCA1_0358 [Lactiplantibacillus pentosus KCA1]TDG92428.1 hypothetical protein C5L29_003196 [Lactiplantibacillus pentosus]GEO50537.1 hypothetical protein LPE01_18980 [Lactiplantibacillus pentosus]GIP68791.1 hypothetical protein AWA1501_09540 [Lactiplantibacillus pentosus]